MVYFFARLNIKAVRADVTEEHETWIYYQFKHNRDYWKQTAQFHLYKANSLSED